MSVFAVSAVHLQHAPSSTCFNMLNKMKHHNRNDKVSIFNEEDGMGNAFC